MLVFNLNETTREELVAKVNVNCSLQLNFKQTEEGIKFGLFGKPTILDCIYKLLNQLGVRCSYITDRNGHDAIIVKDNRFDMNIDEGVLSIYKKTSVAILEEVEI